MAPAASVAVAANNAPHPPASYHQLCGDYLRSQPSGIAGSLTPWMLHSLQDLTSVEKAVQPKLAAVDSATRPLGEEGLFHNQTPSPGRQASPIRGPLTPQRPTRETDEVLSEVTSNERVQPWTSQTLTQIKRALLFQMGVQMSGWQNLSEGCTLIF